jgi:hypothetical protein
VRLEELGKLKKKIHHIGTFFLICVVGLWVLRPLFKKKFKFVLWELEYCGHYWPIVPAPDDRRG